MNSPPSKGSPPRGLAGLADVQLQPAAQTLLDKVSASCLGSPVWRCRKQAEARELLALAQIAPRLDVIALDLRTTFRALLRLDTPVPCLPDPRRSLQIARGAELALRYPEEALSRPMPGHAFLQLLQPQHVWNANIASGHDQRICLGVKLPPGIPVRELVLATYGALTLQTVQIDEQSAAGVLNAEAARWYQRNPAVIPLSQVPFLGTEDLIAGDLCTGELDAATGAER